MLIVQPKYETHEREIEGKKIVLSFYLDNLDSIRADRIMKGMNQDADITDFMEACYRVCVLALKKVEGLEEEFDLQDEAVREGILRCKELITIDEMGPLSMKVRGLGEAVRAVKEGLKDSVDNSLSPGSEKKSVQSVPGKNREHGKSVKKADSVK